jgi:hypothetical protein
LPQPTFGQFAGWTLRQAKYETEKVEAEVQKLDFDLADTHTQKKEALHAIEIQKKIPLTSGSPRSNRLEELKREVASFEKTERKIETKLVERKKELAVAEKNLSKTSAEARQAIQDPKRREGFVNEHKQEWKATTSAAGPEGKAPEGDLVPIALIPLAPEDCPKESKLEGSPQPELLKQWCAKIDSFQRLVKQGPLREWHRNGRRKSEGEFSEDKRSGQWRFWHPTGALSEMGEFEADERVGLWLVYNDRGEKVGKALYGKERVAHLTLFWEGTEKKRADGDLVAHKRSGKWTFWNPGGEVSKELVYKEGVEMPGSQN